MAFDTIKENIHLLQSQSEITAEDLVDSMNKMLDDAESFNSEHKVQEFRVNRIDRYSLVYQNLLVLLNHVFAMNKDKLDELEDDDLNQIHGESVQIQETIAEKKALLEKITIEVSSREKLIQEANKIQIKIDQIQEKLSRTENISIEELKRKEEDLNSILIEQKGRIQKRDDLDGAIDQASTSIIRLDHKIEDYQKKKQDLEEEEKSKNTTIKEYQDWIERHKRNVEGLNNEYEEAINKLNAIRNAWNSIRQRPDFAETLDFKKGVEDKDSGIKSFSELDDWFGMKETQIDTSIDEYQQMYSNVLRILNEGGER